LVSRCRSPANLSASPGGDCDNDSCDEEKSHDDESENPLESNDLVKELRNTNGRGKNTEREAHGVILVDDDEEQSIGENGPNEDVSEDAGHQMVGVRNHQSAIPVDGNKGPGQRSRSNRGVDESRIGVVAEVERRKVNEVQNQDDLGPVEVRSDKEHDKGEVEEVVEDEVASNAGGSVNNIRVAREEVANVTSLEEEEDNPVDGGDGRVQAESSGVHVVLLPDRSVSRVAIFGTADGVVNGDDEGQDPGEESQDLVRENSSV